MKRVVVIILILLGVVLLGMLVLLGIVGVARAMAKGRVPSTTILEVDFEKPIPEYVSQDPLSKIFMGDRMTTRDVVDALERAAEDDRVVSLVARVGSTPMGMAQIEAIREGILHFRESGKKAVAFAETLGEFTASNGGVYLASAFDEVYLQPSGDVVYTGLMVEQPFVRGLLEKLDVEPRMDQRYEYKNAMNFFTHKKFTPAHREATQRFTDSWFEQIVRGVAEGRGLPEEEVRALASRGPFLGQEAVDAGLVDGLRYRDEVYEAVKQEAGEDAKLLYLSKYLKRAGRPHQSGDTVALIYGVGTVVRGESEYDPMSGEQTMGADTVAGAFRKAIRDDKVKAILFRVDSPGGSYVASDTIWREVVRAKEAGKPVVVSMGNLAASGGYFVSMHADRIVAAPGTLTGSIGVLGGKLLTQGLWDKVGITWDWVQTSPRADMDSGLHDYDPQDWERFQAFLDRVYEDFTSKVAEGRGLPLETVQKIARGRVWTGADALDLGLVDETGGFLAAYRAVRNALGLEPDEPFRIQVYPRPKSPLEAIFDEGSESSESRVARTLVRSIQVLRPLFQVVRRAGLLGPEPGELQWMGPEPQVP